MIIKPRLAHKQTDCPCGSEQAHTRLITCTIEVYAIGNDRRAYAKAVLAEVSPRVFTVTPFYLREVTGTYVPWSAPSRGEAIKSRRLISTITEAHRALVFCASRTLAQSPALKR